MHVISTLTSTGLVALLVSCVAMPTSETVAEYCAAPNRTDDHICHLKVDIDGNATALADTNMSLNQARMVADKALKMANTAENSAKAAQETAYRALSLAKTMALKEEDLSCKTRKIQKSDIGTCEAGYTLMSCTQTRYTARAGGLSILREVNSQRCRFNNQVLEMQVRCCLVNSTENHDSIPNKDT